MTIKEYLNFKTIGAEEALKYAKGVEEQAYTEGVLDTWNLMKDIFPSLEQDLTLRETINALNGVLCVDCPLYDFCGFAQGGGNAICDELDVDKVEKKIKGLIKK